MNPANAHPLAPDMLNLLGGGPDAVDQLVAAMESPMEWTLKEAKAAVLFAWRRRQDIVAILAERCHDSGESVGDILRGTKACADIPNPDHVLLGMLADGGFRPDDADDDQVSLLLALAETAAQAVGEAIALQK